MYDYYSMTYEGRAVHIIYAKADSTHDVQLSLMADRYDSSNPIKLASEFHDYALESEGYSRVGVLNGGIFNSEYAPIIFANGFEKAYWTVNENDDDPLNGVMAVSHTGDASNQPIIELQSSAKANLGSYRGGCLAAFGLLRNGIVDKGAWIQGIPTKKSGRAIIGRKSDGTIYLIASPGVSPTSSNPAGIGLSGDQCIALAQSLGLSDAVAMDGGGSVAELFLNEWKVSTSRKVKNAWGLYVKQKSTGGGTGGGETPVFVETKDDGYMPVFKKQIPHKVMHNGQLCPIKEILVMKNGILVPIDELRKGSS